MRVAFEKAPQNFSYKIMDGSFCIVLVMVVVK